MRLHLAPMRAQVQATTGQRPDEWSADCGYFSAQNVAVLEGAGSLALIPPDRQAAAGAVLPPAVAQVLAGAGLGAATEPALPTEAAVGAAMRARLRTERGRRAYARRKQTVEPVFGQIKERQGLRRFLLRGLAKVAGEWTLWCLTHNLRRIVHALRAEPELRRRLVNG
jgi:hypothetical protein